MYSATPALGAPMLERTSGSWTMGSMWWQAHRDVSLVSGSVEHWAVGSIYEVCHKATTKVMVVHLHVPGGGSLHLGPW